MNERALSRFQKSLVRRWGGAIAVLAILATTIGGAARAGDGLQYVEPTDADVGGPLTDHDKLFFKAVQTALKDNNRAWVVAHMASQIYVSLGGHRATIGPKQFAARYDEIITQGVRDALQNESPDDLFKNYQGICAGAGCAVWMQVRSVGSSNRLQYVITTVNEPSPPVAPPKAAPAAPTSCDLRKVDWANFNVPNGPALKGGSARSGANPDGAPDCSLGKVEYADLDGNGSPEAYLPVDCNPAHTQASDQTTIYVFEMGPQCALRSIGTIDAGSMPSCKVVGRSYVIDGSYAKAGDPECCWSGLRRQTYHLSNGKFTSTTQTLK